MVNCKPTFSVSDTLLGARHTAGAEESNGSNDGRVSVVADDVTINVDCTTDVTTDCVTSSRGGITLTASWVSTADPVPSRKDSGSLRTIKPVSTG